LNRYKINKQHIDQINKWSKQNIKRIQ